MSPPCSRALRLAVCLATVAPTSALAQTSTVDPVTAGLADFGLAAFREVVREAAAPNVVFSPLSVGLALALLAEGASGDTQAELFGALGVEGEGWPDYRARIAGLVDELAGDTTVRINLGNSVWADDRGELSDDFEERARRFHRAEIRVEDLQDPGSPKRIGRWVSDVTEGRITGEPPPAGPLTVLMLYNAVYFNGLWDTPFDTTATRPAPFLAPSGDSVDVETMHRTGRYGHFDADGARGLRLPYRDARFAAYVVVPDGDRDPFLGSLSAEAMAAWASSVVVHRTRLTLPRLENRGAWDLRKPMARAGLPGVAEGPLSLEGVWTVPPESDLRLERASQATFLKLDEAGTEAAAATGIVVGGTAAPPPPLDFPVDRPFLLVLRDDASGALLFTAWIGDPRHRGP